MFNPAGTKIAKNLCGVFIGDGLGGFQFDNQFSFNK